MADPSSRTPSFGRNLARMGPRMDARGAAERRRRLVDPRRPVIEIGAGYGATFPFYPAAVTAVLALEPDPTLRCLALPPPPGRRCPSRCREGVAEALPAADASIDVVVSSLVLCSVAEQSAALAEAVRVLRPGGLLLFYEHVRSANRLLGAAEDLLTPPWSRLAGGCHPNRDTAAAIAGAGLTVQALERFGFSALPGNPRVAHILGVAAKAGARACPYTTSSPRIFRSDQRAPSNTRAADKSESLVGSGLASIRRNPVGAGQGCIGMIPDHERKAKHYWNCPGCLP